MAENDLETYPNQIALAEQTASLICHDLAGQVGALGNLLELMTLEIDGQSDSLEEAIELGNATVKRSIAMVNFLRLAYGSGSEEMISRNQLTQTVENLYSGSVKVNWQLNNDMPRNHAKLLFLALTCATQALPRGGLVTVRAGAGYELRVEGDAVDPARAYPASPEKEAHIARKSLYLTLRKQKREAQITSSNDSMLMTLV